MSAAKKVMDLQGYKLLDDKEKEVNLFIAGDFNILYEPPTVVENKDYFRDYLTDGGSVFGRKFESIVSIGLDDLKIMGYKLYSLDIKDFDEEPFFKGQKKVYILMSSKVKPNKAFFEITVMPTDIKIEFDVKEQKIGLFGDSVGKAGYFWYKV